MLSSDRFCVFTLWIRDNDFIGHNHSQKRHQKLSRLGGLGRSSVRVRIRIRVGAGPRRGSREQGPREDAERRWWLKVKAAGGSGKVGVNSSP